MHDETKLKIHQFEASPPPAAWQHIEAALAESPRRSAAVPMWVRIAASVILIAGAAIFWYQQSPAPKNKITANTDPQAGSGVIITPGPQTATPPASTTTGIADEAPDARDLVSAHLAHNGTPRASDVNDPTSLTSNYTYGIMNLAPSLQRTNTCNVPLNNNYFYLTSGSGNQVRISRKLAAAMRDELNLPELSSSLSINEIQQLSARISSWRNRIAHSAFIPSAENFLDLIALMDMMDEK